MAKLRKLYNAQEALELYWADADSENEFDQYIEDMDWLAD